MLEFFVSTSMMWTLIVKNMIDFIKSIVVERAGLVPWVGGPLDASLGFYLREVFQSQTEDIIQQESLGIDML